VASFAGFFPVDQPKYSCIVVIHEPNKKKGYYGAKVAAPVFREIAQKIYTSTPVEREVVPDDFNAQMIKDSYAKNIESIDDKKVPNVKGMPAMDAISLLENIGLKVKVNGIGKVKKQSIRKGTPIKKGATIILNLS
jgi:cell division protein FtsI (penicillin-binding protein 3)